MNDNTNVLLVVGALVIGVAVGFLLCPPVPESVIPPYVDAGPDIMLNECCSARLTCKGYDSSGGPVTYHWTAEDGKGSFNNAYVLHPTYTAPPICVCWDDITLTLTVTSKQGLSASDSMVARVRGICYLPLERCCPITPAPCRVMPVPPYCAVVPVPHCPPQPAPPCVPVIPYCPPVLPLCAPIPSCIDACSAKSVNEGGSIQLFGTVCDPDNNVVSYRWTADKGTFDDPTSLNPIYYAPMTNACGGEYACITLTAVDSCCARGSDQLLLHITNVNHLPVADAGEDITVNECSSVRLTCSGHDPDGDALSYYWTASCGRGSFSDPYALHPVYVAPSTDRCEGENIVLTLTVTDTCGASATDSMIVHVDNATNTPPAVKADP
jgi:hypothetical protein